MTRAPMARFRTLCSRDGQYQNFLLSIIAQLNATIIVIVAIPTAKLKKEVFVLLQDDCNALHRASISNLFCILGQYNVALQGL